MSENRLDLNSLNPKARQRCEKIIEVALELFLKKGYENTSLSDIVEMSGGSFSTIYKYFENKEELFKFIIIDGIKSNFDFLNTKINHKLEMDEFLYKFGFNLMKRFTHPQTVAFYRLILNEGLKVNSKIAFIYYEYGVKAVHQILIDYFKECENQEILSKYDYDKLAAIFICLIKGPFLNEAFLVGKDIKLTQKDLEKHVKFSVEVFLNGILKADYQI